MSKYASLLGIQEKKQQDLVNHVAKVDPRVDKSLLSKYANDVCLPTARQLNAICNFLDCAPLDIYERKDIDLLAVQRAAQEKIAESGDNKNTLTSRRRRLNKKGDIYNLTIEISRVTADKVFAAKNLKRLGFLSITDLVRHLIQGLYEDLIKEEKKKAV